MLTNGAKFTRYDHGNYYILKNVINTVSDSNVLSLLFHKANLTLIPQQHIIRMHDISTMEILADDLLYIS